MHAIGSPEGVTLLEFEAGNQEEQQEVQPQGEGEHNPEALLECPNHQPSVFVKDKPWSILSLLCFHKYQLELFMFDALSYRSWMEPLDAYIFPYSEIYLEHYVGPG
jgi:hypothetical protein